MSSHLTRVPLLAAAALALPLAPVQAQSIWLPATRGPSVSIEALKPILTEGNDAWTTATTAFFLSGRIPVAESAALIAELPVAHAGFKRSVYGGSGTESSTVIGNPYVGIEFGGTASGVTADLGAHIPIRKDEDGDMAGSVGLMADVDRMEAYFVDVLAVGGHLGVRHSDASGLFVRARGGPTAFIYTGDRSEGDDTDVMLDYAAQAGYDTGRFMVVGGLTGRTLLTTEGGSWQENSFHQLGLSGNIAVGGVRPGILVRIPVDEDLGDTLRYVLGLSLTVPLR